MQVQPMDYDYDWYELAKIEFNGYIFESKLENEKKLIWKKNLFVWHSFILFLTLLVPYNNWLITKIEN